MRIQIECVSEKKSEPTIYMAHFVDEKNNFYKCGACMKGDIRVHRGSVLTDSCKSCGAIIRMVKDECTA